MTISKQLREHALYHRTGWVHDIQNDVAWSQAFSWARVLEGEDCSEETPTSTERRMFLLFVAEALESS